MSLNKKQFRFEQMCNLLEAYMIMEGYQYSTGDAARDARTHGKFGEIGPKGIKAPYGATNSFHKLRLARDYHLFKDGKYLSKTSDHKKFGEFWESLDPNATWGGRFRRKDGNHYSYGEKKR